MVLKKCVPTKYFHMDPFCCIVSSGVAAEGELGTPPVCGNRDVYGKKQEGCQLNEGTSEGTERMTK